MADKLSADSRVKRNRILKSLIINTAVIALAVYLFIPAGPVQNAGKIDLSFLLLPIIGYCVLRLAAAFCLIFIASRTGFASACLLRGAAAGFLLYLVFDKAVLLTRVPFLSGLQKFLSELTSIENYTILFTLGLTLSAIFSLYNMRTREQYWGPPGISLGQLIMGFSLWQSIGYYSRYWNGFEGLGIVFMAGMSALAVSTLGLLGEKSGNSLIADFCTWLRTSPVGKFFIGASLAVYLIFIRPELFDHVPYAFLIEWILICGVVWRIYRDINHILRSRYSVVPVDLDWQKHVQKVDDLFDEDFNKIGLLQKDFVELGTRRQLLNYLRQVLIKNNLTDDQINQVLKSLIEYSDKKVPWYVIWFWRKRKIQRNMESRKSALQDTIGNLSEIAHPKYQKTGVKYERSTAV